MGLYYLRWHHETSMKANRGEFRELSSRCRHLPKLSDHFAWILSTEIGISSAQGQCLWLLPSCTDSVRLPSSASHPAPPGLWMKRQTNSFAPRRNGQTFCARSIKMKNVFSSWCKEHVRWAKGLVFNCCYGRHSTTFVDTFYTSPLSYNHCSAFPFVYELWGKFHKDQFLVSHHANIAFCAK